MHKSLPDCKIDFDFFTKAEYPEATSCIKHQVHELNDIHEKYGGFPESYDFQNTQIRQKWWTEEEVDSLKGVLEGMLGTTLYIDKPGEEKSKGLKTV